MPDRALARHRLRIIPSPALALFVRPPPHQGWSWEVRSMLQPYRPIWMRLALAEAVVIALSAVALLTLLGLDEHTLNLLPFMPH
jgi:hypothetical protein